MTKLKKATDYDFPASARKAAEAIGVHVAVESAKASNPTPDMAAELASRLTAVAGELAEQGIEATVSVQRIPVAGWRFLRPVVKVTCRPGKPV